ncbi:MAG: hypothetical protein AAGI72_23500 [Pseudomonadota bacterium]
MNGETTTVAQALRAYADHLEEIDPDSTGPNHQDPGYASEPHVAILAAYGQANKEFKERTAGSTGRAGGSNLEALT